MSDDIERLVINAVTATVAPLEAQVSQQNAQLTLQAARRALHRTTFTQIDSELVRQDTLFAQQVASIAQQGVQIRQLGATITPQEALLAEQAAQIAQQKTLIAEQDAQNEQQGSKIAQQSTQIAQQDIRIGNQDTRIADLENTAAENEERFEQVVNLLAPEQISNLATQILLFFLRNQPFDLTGPSVGHFGGLKGARHRQFHYQFDGQQDGSGIVRRTEEWTARFDSLIRTRNMNIHFRDWDALERKVVNVRKFLLRHPHLKAMQEDEVFVINNFEKFRSSPLPKVSAKTVRR